MSQDSFIEKLEETHSFPGPYTLKVIGTNDASFIAQVLRVARESLDLPDDPEHSSRESKSGKHISVTLELTVESAHGVVRLYEEMHQIEGLTMLI